MPKKTMAGYAAEQLETAKRHVAETQARIDQQLVRMEKFRAKGWDLAEAERILAQMYRLLEIGERHRDDLAREIERGHFSN